MEKKQFKIEIAAPREKVWKILWGDETYPAWTSVFSEGSKVETTGKKEVKCIFQMTKAMAWHLPLLKKYLEFMSFKHLGMVKNGVEDLNSEQIKEWPGAQKIIDLKLQKEKPNQWQIWI